MNPSRFPELNQWLIKLKSDLQSGKYYNNFGTDLQTFRNELKGYVYDLRSLQRGYKRVVDQYLDNHKPFPSSPSNLANDINQYLELIQFCLIVEDIDLLQCWGINYPRQTNFEVLAEHPSQYVKAFNLLCTDRTLQTKYGLPDEVIPYLEYLRDNL